ncbi:MAG: hypothetical protein ABT14_02455 [Pelagibacterium sp. SCN 63-17]|nr:MAG: hypothetical protein ABT14_02455 [Pelagibacterium sp. SCN 63-17]
MKQNVILIAMLLGTTSLAHGHSLDEQINAFIGAEGFERQDLLAIETGLANEWLDRTAIAPGGAVGPLEKAAMIATSAIDSIRTRTAISYGELLVEEDGAPMPVSFIEVRHYNLGQIIRAETVEAYGEGDVADEAAFGLGEHMAWRFVFQPIMGNTAMLVDASRRVISDKEATKDRCNDRPCLDTAALFDDIAQWDDIAGTLPSWPDLYPADMGGVATPAHAIAELAVLGYWANAEAGTYAWTGGEHPEAAQGIAPYRFIGIDRNLGQEDGIDTVWQETALNDDAIASIAFRRIDVAGTVYYLRTATPRPGH